MIFDQMLKISCVMVTTGRDYLIHNSIQCFRLQSYPNKELIIVSQGNKDQNDNIKKIIGNQNDIFFLEAPRDLTLGAMRNLSIELSTGKIICQWDDDDLYHPLRLITQYKNLRNGVASLYVEHLKFFKQINQLYAVRCDDGTDDYKEVLNENVYKKFLTGSVMFNKSCFYYYNNVLYPEFGLQSSKEEDLNVLQKLLKLGNVIPVRGLHYVYVYHGNNTYDLKHHEMGLHKKRILSEKELLSQKEEIDFFSNVGLSGANVCTSEIVDFDQDNASFGRNVIFTI